MIDFGLSKGQLEIAGLVCVAALVAIPFLRCALDGMRELGGKLPLPTIIVIMLCMAQSMIVGGTKTNGVNNLPPQQMMQGAVQGGAASCRAGDLERGNFIWRGGTPHLLASCPDPSFAERVVRNWNIRGAFDDSFWLDFEDGFVLPEGTNHLEGVEVLASGKVWRTPFDTNAIATIGAEVSIVPGLSSFDYEFTPSNSYRFVWTDAAVNRDTNNLITAAIELFRNGDITVATNGVAAYLPRVLPFAHDGFGQDAEWVTANFTNAAEILSVGYPQWVDEQVGTGLTNGLYKLTVAVADDPPEMTCITVGDLSVAVTNAGEYVFLLGKGVRYDLSASSDCATNFVYSAVDDIVFRSRLAAGRFTLQGEGSQEGTWTSDSGELSLFWPFEFVEWKPSLSISPRKWKPSRANAVRSFTATLTDIPWYISPSFAWSSADSAVCSCEDASDRTATFTCKFPAAYGNSVSLGLDVMLSRTVLHADFWRYIGYFCESEDYEETIDDCEDCEPSPGLVVSASPSVVFFEKGTANSTSAEVGCFYQVSEAGTFELTVSGDVVSLTDQTGAPVSSGYTWETDGGVVGARHFFVESSVKSSSPSGTVFTVAFTPDEGTNTLSGTDNVTFVEWETETVETWPSDRHRKELGVGEKVSISFDPMVNFAYIACAIPSGSVVSSGSGRYRYTAPTNACVDAACFHTASGCVCTVPFSVFEPSGNLVVNIASNVVNQMNVAGDFDIVFDLVLMPTNVSFNGRVQIIEVGMVSTNASGYFAAPSRAGMLDHSQHGANVWVDIGIHNSSGTDTASPGSLLPPFSDGSFTWPIPNHWRMKGDAGSGKWFCNDDQHFAITSNGTSSVWKFGKKGLRMLNSNILTISDEAIP